jgi:hypothetical protein
MTTSGAELGSKKKHFVGYCTCMMKPRARGGVWNFEAGFCENSKFVVFVTICDCACMRISSRITVPAALKLHRPSINAFVKNHQLTILL